jgi:hypothetical protein
MKHYIIASLMIAGSPLQAAPFMVCNLDVNSRVIVDFGDNTMKIDADWVYAQVTVGEDVISAIYVESGYYLGIVHSDKTNKSYWKAISPEEGEAYGEAFCTYQER